MWYSPVRQLRKVTLLLPLVACAQWEGTQVLHGRPPYTRADTLLGSLNPYRYCYDVTHYALHITLRPSQEALAGEVTCTFRWKGSADTLQIDLDERLAIKAIQVDDQQVRFQRIKGTRAVWVALGGRGRRWEKGSLHHWRVVYGGKPRKAPRPPWDGGLVWSKTPTGHPWIGVACQGEGASLWWPLKDHLSDEPDSVTLTFCAPAPLRVIANGILISASPHKKDTCFTYKVSYPINTYNITFYAAPGYQVFEDTFYSASGRTIPLRFSLLPEHVDKHVYLAEEARKTLRAFEHYFGPFPVQKDGYGLVESPYYGMEHQSAIAYGNAFRKEPKWNFDYIILHESGHEWWGNHVTAADNADLWIQEGFCTYAEALFIEYYYGYESAIRYLLQQRSYIQNRFTIQAPYGVNADQIYNTDIYYKMAWVLHTLRSRINNDSVWFACLRAIQDTFSFKTISAQELIDFMSRQLRENLWPFFRAYLYYLRPPVLSYKVVEENGRKYLLARWITEEKAFTGPMEFLAGEKRLRFNLSQNLQKFALPEGVSSVVPDKNRFYVIVTSEP